MLRTVAKGHTDHTIRKMARAAMGRLANASPTADPNLVALRNELLNAQTLESRAPAAERLADAGAVRAIPLLPLSFAGAISSAARDAAGRAFGRLGDAESIDTFGVALEQRDHDHDRAKTAAYALGYLGDIRGLRRAARRVRGGLDADVVAEAIAAVGPAAIPSLLELVEERTALLKRRPPPRCLKISRARSSCPRSSSASRRSRRPRTSSPARPR